METETIKVISYFIGYIIGSGIATYFSCVWMKAKAERYQSMLDDKAEKERMERKRKSDLFWSTQI